MAKLSVKEATAAVAATGGDFVRLLERPSCDVSLYKPAGVDSQKPHLRDELYVVASGSGSFEREGQTEEFGPGDVFFVAAGEDHRFKSFSSDFATWVIFLGPRENQISTLPTPKVG
jgi:mannose-6-phosphate isomerase-like protein (cupin superfamily)